MSSIELITHSGLERSLKVIIPAKTVDEQVKKQVNQYAQGADWRGFRKGKVPKNLIQSKIGQQIRANVLNDLLQPSLMEAIQEKSLELAGQPTIDLLVNEQGKDLEYEAKFEILPEIKLVDLTTCSVKNPVVELPEQAILDGMEKVKKQHMSWEEVDEEASEAHQVSIDFKGLLNGEPFPGGEAKNYTFVLGEKQMLQEFEKAILGKRAGDTIEFPLTFPKDYHQKTLAGLTATFVVKLHGVRRGEMPELNKEFYDKIDVEEATEEAFKQAVREPLESELKGQLDNLRKARLYGILLKKHKFDLPNIMVEQEVQRLREETQQQQKLPTLPEATPETTKEAEKRVLLSMVTSGLMKELDLKLDSKRLEQFVKSKAMPYIDEQQFIDWFNSDEQRVEMAKRQVLEEQLAEACFLKMKSKDEVIAYDKLGKIIEEEWNL